MYFSNILLVILINSINLKFAKVLFKNCIELTIRNFTKFTENRSKILPFLLSITMYNYV